MMWQATYYRCDQREFGDDGEDPSGRNTVVGGETGNATVDDHETMVVLFRCLLFRIFLYYDECVDIERGRHQNFRKKMRFPP